jgi:hypothetical protein
MDSTVDAMAAAYDALIDAAAAAVREPGRGPALEDLKRCLDAFSESCDRAEDLVQAAAAGLLPSPSATSRLDALPLAVHAIEKDLVQAAAADVDERDEKEVEVEEERDSAPTPPVPVPEAAEGE